MLNFPTNVRLYLATEPVDLRRSYDGLSALVDGTFGRQAMSGDLYIFMNRRANQVRILFWDRDGYVIMMKRLEEGTFRRVKAADGKDLVEIDAGELAMLLEGIDAPSTKRRRRYRAPESESTTSASSTLSLHS
jgi:transposase